jgi:TM2 domain-containing membrane protein YozV
MGTKKSRMRNSLTGALWSGLIFPGLGQIILKQYTRGIVLMVAVCSVLAVMVIKAVQQAFTILEKIERMGGIIDRQTITDAVTQASSPANSLLYNLGSLFIGICWIFGIVDAYRIGKKKDAEDTGTSSRPKAMRP